MNMRISLPVALIVFSPFLQALPTETLVDRLLSSYAHIQTVTCEVRKTTESSAGKMRMLSRVYYQQPDRIHVDNFTPLKRRIIADGSHFYSCFEGAAKGFSRPIDELNDDMVISLRKVPGTPMDHLLRLRGVPEIDMEPEDGFLVRKGYQADKTFVILSLDSKRRLARIEFYTSPRRKEKTAQYEYGQFKEVLSGVWIPCLHNATRKIRNSESKETVRITNLTVNEPIAKSLFVPGPFFKNVQFVDNFADIFTP